MAGMLRMSEMQAGTNGTVVTLGGETEFVRRLLELGLTEGSRVSCLFQSLWRDPTAFEICGSVIALRRKDCADIFVKETTS